MRRSDEETERKRARESRVVHEMIALYCRGIHHTAKGSLCPECEALDAYAQKRIARCPFMRTKTFCSVCSVHCYAPKRQEEIRQVMRYADPRILLPPSCHVFASRSPASQMGLPWGSWQERTSMPSWGRSWMRQ